MKRLNTGNLRQILVSTTNAASGTVLGTFNVQHFSNLAGMVQAVGSLTVQCRFGVASGSYQVSSSFVANSGGSTFSLTNFGLFANLSVTAAASQQATILVCGVP